MTDVAATPPETLSRAREIAREHGVRFAYTGNIHGPQGDSTFCSHCDALLIGRNWYELNAWSLDARGRCRICEAPIAMDDTRGAGTRP